ncbi:allophanate hydrolase [Micromonospora sp. NBC_01813]|uniref:allophanate hydrolase n=1 Tax=Micromonospora sp. NBC_01813 TaxID=2975988 RepID=UPI002DDAD66C|nr:allophanate hydrolase [Micromonospora sp. NBC_01813]WSA09091.1 allophanate hydrolase [Micromonospora sp. NBC_01813]
MTPTAPDAVAATRDVHRAADPDQPIWITLLDPAEVADAAARVDPAAPLAGTAVAIKDNLDLAGHPTTAGCPALADRPATSTATAVRRLVDAGAVILGKTNLDQFATGLVGTRSPYGACHSVASAAHVSGGSSSGSAVAVATGLVPLALGTDTAGSGRVPAAFNGIVGVKPTRGLISTAGVLPACASLDCVTTFTRTVAEARPALAALAWADPDDPWSRPAPAQPPAGIATRMRVVAVPDRPLGLDPAHEIAWRAALTRLGAVAAHVVEVDVTAFLDAARLLYEGPWLAARWAAFGQLLEPDGPHLDPTVRDIVRRGRDVPGADVFAGLDRLAALRRRTEPIWSDVDALLLPVTPGHPTLAEVAADPVGVNARLGRFTNFVNLLDLCAVAVPAGQRRDGLPFGVQLIAPAFADAPLLDLAAAWCGEPVADAAADATGSIAVAGATGSLAVAVAGAHLTGLPLNPQLVDLGGRLAYRARTAPGYRLYRLAGPGLPRPGLVRTGDGPAGGIAVEVWQLPHQAVGALLGTVPAPLGLGSVELDDGSRVVGFLAEEHGVRDAVDVSAAGGWRAAVRPVGPGSP